MIILVSTISAITYFEDSELFDAKIIQLNQNGNFSVDLEIENKIHKDLNFEIEIIYRRGNLVVDSKFIKCKTTCKTNLKIDKIFFDKYTIKIRTIYNGRGYEKKLHFKYEKQTPSFTATVPNIIYWDFGDLIIPVNFSYDNKNKKLNYILDIYPTKRPELKSTYTLKCLGDCKESFIISNSILFGGYSINIYSNINVLKLTFNVTPSNITKSQNRMKKGVKSNQTINQSKNSLENKDDTSLEEILGYTKIEYDENNFEESEEIRNCIISNNLGDEFKQEREKELSSALCKFNKKLNNINENFEIKNIPNSIEMGKNFEFEITIPSGSDLNNSNFNLPEGFEIFAQKKINKYHKIPSKINTQKSFFNSKLNQVTTPVSKSFLVKGTVTSLSDTVQIFENKGWLKKDLKLDIKKSQELIKFENIIKVEVNKIKKNTSSNKSDLTIFKNNSQIDFEEIELENIDKIEIIKKSELIDYNPNIRNNLETDIINVLADDFSKATIILKKTNNKQIKQILVCDYFGENQCTSGWKESRYNITQNQTHVWFDVTHFSAYSGVGGGYIFDIDFKNYEVTKFFQNQTKSVNVSVECDSSGTCGLINVSLHTPGIPITNLADFESGFGSWSSGSSGCYWRINSGRTSSSSTGPGGNGLGFDHTLGTSAGSYIYTETSSNACSGGQTATLTGTNFNIGSITSKISFWYHMAADTQSSNMGNLHLDVYDGSSWINDVWVVSGVQQFSTNPFLFAEVDLSSYSGLINTRFRMTGNSGWQGDVTLDDIKIESFGLRLTNTSIPPFKIDGPDKIQVSLLQGENKYVEFKINATGLEGDVLEIYSVGISSTESYVKSLSNKKFLTISETVPPSGIKTSPIDLSTSILKTVTFVSNVTDNSALSKSTINIWNSNGNLVTSETKVASGTSDTISFDYSFTNNGIYTWNILVEDISGNSAWLGSNWSITLDFPGVGLNFIDLPDNFQIIKDTNKNISINISCTNTNCGLTNVTLSTYIYSPPIFSDFESGNMGIWSNVLGDDFEWELIRADTPRSGVASTGINTDHTTGLNSGYFVYYETSSGDATISGPTYLETSSFLSSGIVSLNFWYNMYAPQNPTLAVEYFDGLVWTEIWTITGDQGTGWINEILTLNHFGNIKFRFVATKNGGNGNWQQDISLDDILITPNPYLFIDNLTTTPFYVSGQSIQQISLNDGDSATLSFELNVTGPVGSTYFVIARGQSNLDSNLDGQSQSKQLEIVGSFDVKLNSISLSQTTRQAGESIQITCEVLNSITNEVINDFKVTFSSSRTGTISTQYTNYLGLATTNYIIAKTPTPFNLSEDLSCLIENDLIKKYYPTIENNLSTQLNVTESAPWYSNWGITGGTGQNRMRNNIIVISANWSDNFNLSNSKLEHNGTGVFTNFSQTSISGKNYFQNYILDLTNKTQFSNVGPIYFNSMHGTDNFGWTTQTSPQLYLNLYGYADITKILPTPAAVGNWGESSSVYCEVKDNYTGIAIPNYPVSFNSNTSGLLGTNNTDIFGRAYMSDTIISNTNFSCTISDRLGLYYYANKNSESVIISRDQVPPSYSNWGFKYSSGINITDGTNINNTESVFVHSYWTDNYQLYYGYLTHNGTGTFENHIINPFPIISNSPTSWANQTLQFTNSSIFNKVGRIELSRTSVSDKANNLASTTPSKYFYLHGFANATNISIDKLEYGPNTTITINCQITDSTHKGPIENFSVDIISNETGLINSVQTNILGIATTTYQDTTPGKETISCTINSTTYHYVDSSSTNKEVSFDNTIPYTISNYGVTPNIIHVGESVNIHALWDEQINSSTIYTDQGNFPVLTYQNNWTNGTITADLSWLQGARDISFINTVDNNLNTNHTTSNLTLDMYHYSDITDITLMFSSINVNSAAYFGCRVQDTDLNSDISGYNVSFYEDGIKISSALTGTNGWAQSSYVPNSTGIKIIKCDIQRDTVNYYDPVINANQQVSLSVVALSGRACAGDTLSVPYNNYFDSALDDGFQLVGTNCITGSNNNFASWINQVTSVADSGSYSRIGTDEKIIHSNGVLDLGPELRLECRNSNTRDESYTHMYKNIDPASLIGLKVLVYYTDRSVGTGLALDSSPNNIVLFPYNSNQNTVNSSTYITQSLSPITSACTGEDNTGFGATAYYQEVDQYPLIQSMLNEGLSTVDLRMAIYTHSNYDGGNDLARWYYNEIELYTKQLFVSMLTPVSTIESYENKTESLTCTVQTSGTNTSNVDLYPQFCIGLGCSNFTNIQLSSGLLQVNESTYSCSDSSCSKTFTIDKSTTGIYNLRCNSTNFDSYSIGSTSEQLIIYKSNLTINNITHNIDSNNEFEIGDKINEIKVSIQNDISGKSYSPSVTINLINSSGEIPNWSTQLPNSKYCPSPMLQNTTCNLSFKNSETGFTIDNIAKEGIYNISTNLVWDNLGNITQTNKSIYIWDLKDIYTSTPNSLSINQGSSTSITVNFTNPTSNNLTNLHLYLNCPLGFTCDSSNIYTIVLPGQTITSIFTINSTLTTPTISHNFTFDVTYKNIRGFSKFWTNVSKTSLNITNSIFIPEMRNYNIYKTITLISRNNYLVNLEIKNLKNFIQNISVKDFVDSKFTTSNFNFPINLSYPVSGYKYTGTSNIWNFTLSNYEIKNINYTLSIALNNPYLKNNYIIGLD